MKKEITIPRSKYIRFIEYLEQMENIYGTKDNELSVELLVLIIRMRKYLEIV